MSLEKTLLVGKIELVYYDLNPDAGQTIFYLHGNSLSSRVWKKQIDSGLFDHFRHLSLDLPAHGHSMGSSDPEQDYSLTGLGKIMAGAVNLLSGKKPYIIAGISLGTNIAAEMLPFLVRPPHGLILAGPCVIGEGAPLAGIVLDGVDASAIFTDEVTVAQVEKYGSETSLSRDPVDVAEFLQDHVAVKGPFRSSLFKSIQMGHYKDQLHEIRKTGIPLLIIFGGNERVIRPDYLDRAGLNTWRGIFKIQGASHLVNIDQPAAFNALMMKYLEDLIK